MPTINEKLTGYFGWKSQPEEVTLQTCAIKTHLRLIWLEDVNCIEASRDRAQCPKISHYPITVRTIWAHKRDFFNVINLPEK
jgi:hypothetical protein